ncbi:quinon protein alcohol dehydrogenase-like superfamily, partial [Tribonema minus]
MRVLTADETGLVKVWQVESRKLLVTHGLGHQSRVRGVRGLCWGLASDGTSPDYSRVHVGRENGVVEDWSVSHTAAKGKKLPASATVNQRSQREGCPASIVSLHALPGTASEADSPPTMVACSATGEVRVAPCDAAAGEGSSFKAPAPVHTAIGRGGVLATGGQDNDIKVWDVATGQCTWRAKNVPMDAKLQLSVPVWPSALAPLRAAHEDPALTALLAGTAHRHIRLYDTRAARRPRQTIDYGEHRITALCVIGGGGGSAHTAIVGDAAGELTALDLRALRRRRRYGEPGGGAVRAFAVHPTLPVFAAVGLDRVCRVYDVSGGGGGGGAPLAALYLKQRASRVLFCDEGRATPDGAIDRAAAALEGGDDGWGSAEEYEMGAGSSEEGDAEESEMESEGD